MSKRFPHPQLRDNSFCRLVELDLSYLDTAQAADSERKTRWKRGPVNWTPMRRSPGCDSATCTTRPLVAKSFSSMRRDVCRENGMRISRSEPTATSKRVTKAAPLRQRFSLEVSSSKITPRESRPRTLRGRRTAILRSERCLETVVLASGTMGWVPVSVDCGRSALEEAFYALEDFRGRARRMYDATKLAAVPHAMSKPASELLHFAYTVGQVGSINLPIVAHQ